jgi:hypothetical protein
MKKLQTISAQGTLEYLVIIAIVIVIALVVVGLLTGFFSQGTQVNETQSKIYWQTQPLAITDSLTDSSGNMIIVIKNNTSENQTINSIVINDVETFPDNLTLARGETKTIYLNKPSLGATNQNQIKIVYTTPLGLQKTQLGNTTLNTQTTNTINTNEKTILLNQENCFDWNSLLTIHPICTCDDLNTIDFNSTTKSWTYELQNNLDFKNCHASYTSGAGFKPIGTEALKFTGHFLGNNKTIKNLYIYRPDTNYVGLFGYITDSTKDVNDLGMIDSNITGFWYAGGISGRLGRVNNSYNTGTINGTKYTGGINGIYGIVNNSYNTGNINGTDSTGGIIGSFGTVNNSYNAGNINGTRWYIGGIIGIYGTINNSYNTGNVNGTHDIGGINGLGGNVNNSYNTGTIKGLGRVGGVIGYHRNQKFIVNSFSTGTIIGTSNVYGTIGQVQEGGTILNLYWFDSNTLDNATTCYHNGDANCTILNDTNYTQLFNSNTTIYTTEPAWDNNWTWTGNNYPKLAWE